MTWYHFLADVVVVTHALYIAVVLVGLLAVLLGSLLRWRWVRNFWFRVVHLLMIGTVVAQALLGIICPLTTLENYLRSQAGEETYSESFIGHWAHELIFYEGPPWVFTLCYCLFGAMVLATLVLVPPRWPWGRAAAGHRGQ